MTDKAHPSKPRTDRDATSYSHLPDTSSISLPQLIRSARDVSLLQRTIGNRATARLLAQRPTISPASKSSIQRDYELVKDGAIYESETFGTEGSKRERVNYVELQVKITKTTNRGAAPPPLTQYTDGGDSNEAVERKAGYDGGHVVGLQIGGHDISENVVPMFKAFNRGVYKTMEETVRKKSLELQQQGKEAWIVVYCHYADENADIPYAFEVMLDAKTEDGSRSGVYYEFLRQPDDIKLVGRLDEESEKLVKGETNGPEVKQKAGQKLEEDKGVFELGMYKTVEAYIKAIGHLPPSKNKIYPDYVNLRPYEFLDMLAFSGVYSTGTGMESYRDFSPAQRTLILQANMARNGGVIKSDDSNDKINDGVLSEQGDLNFPEIDHIVPKSSGGANYFSNARVVSWQLNNKDDRVKSLLGVVDMSKRAFPSIGVSGLGNMTTIVSNYMGRVKPTGNFTIQMMWSWALLNFSTLLGTKLTPARARDMRTAMLGFISKGIAEIDGGGYKLKVKL